MILAPLTLLALLHPDTALAQDPGEIEPPPPNRNYVAVVIGLSSYQNLPEPVELDFARSDAATVASALQEKAGYQHVFALADGRATRQEILDILRTEVAQLLGPNDVFVLYFVGHGVGADLDLPVLLAYDSTLENGQEDGLELKSFARDLLTWTRAGTTLLVTDAIHRNQLDGIYFYGPSATQWPQLPPGTMVVSSSQTSRPAGDGVFGPIFAAGMGGAADANADGYISAQELFSFLLDRLEPEGQVPVSAGDFEPDMILAQGVEPVTADTVAERVEEIPEPSYPEYPIDKAKFVWTEGAAQSVKCRDSAVTACAPSCYVWNFTSGPCTVRAVVDGTELSGEVVVLQRGRYTCRRKEDKLVCLGP